MNKIRRKLREGFMGKRIDYTNSAGINFEWRFAA
jgi:hypothetical protein